MMAAVSMFDRVEGRSAVFNEVYCSLLAYSRCLSCGCLTSAMLRISVLPELELGIQVAGADYSSDE